VSWGEAPSDALAFMISPKQGDELRGMMKRGRVAVRMRARSRRSEPGEIGQVMAEIPGEVEGQDVVLASHLDHQKQGANDNASGAGTLLEIARTIRALTGAGTIARPRRTLRFWWSTEIRSEEEYFKRHPEEKKRILLAVVLDQAGGNKRAENNVFAIQNPKWLPSWADDLIYDLAESFKDRYAPPEIEPQPLGLAPGGGKQSLRMVYFPFEPISDHASFAARRVGIPAISLAAPSLDVIHTDQDTMDLLDPTWMKRSALLTAASALYVAGAGPKEGDALLQAVFRRAGARIAEASDRKAQLAIEKQRLRSVSALGPVDTAPLEARLEAAAAALDGR
jgi:hypothetical protein